MSHNRKYEPMSNSVIWVGAGMMVFTILVFLLFTLGQMYWG
jgi:uncharacterized membrane protein YidH (DUF202 family)